MRIFEFFRTKKPGVASQSTSTADLNKNNVNLKPSLGEVAKRAYLRYVSQGSLHGHDKQHWLEAEAQLVAERNLSKVDLFRNWT